MAGSCGGDGGGDSGNSVGQRSGFFDGAKGKINASAGVLGVEGGFGGRHGELVELCHGILTEETASEVCSGTWVGGTREGGLVGRSSGVNKMIECSWFCILS